MKPALVLIGFLAGAASSRYFADPPPLVVTFELKPPATVYLSTLDAGSTSQTWSGLGAVDSSYTLTCTMEDPR